MRTSARLAFTGPDGGRHDEKVWPDGDGELHFRVELAGRLALLKEGDELRDVILWRDVEMPAPGEPGSPTPGSVSTTHFAHLRVVAVVDRSNPQGPEVRFAEIGAPRA
jgi:hypothetical protein